MLFLLIRKHTLKPGSLEILAMCYQQGTAGGAIAIAAKQVERAASSSRAVTHGP